VRDAGYGVIVVETASGGHYVIAVADSVHQGNLLGDTRRWCREYGYQFSVKVANERISPAQANIFVLPEDLSSEFRTTYTIASGFTHSGLSGREPLPAGYVRVYP
jgi:hypothetical protein